MSIVPAATNVRTRTRPGETQSAPPNWMKRGHEAQAVAEKEIELAEIRKEERAKERKLPWRFFLKAGERADVIILDAEPGPCFYEHNMQGRDGKWGNFETCPKEFESCPLCEGMQGGKPSYFVMLLTVIDMRQRTGKQGQIIPWTKRTLAIKQAQHGLYHRMYERHGTLRGLHLILTRDTDHSPNTGSPEVHAQYTEEQIIQAFQHPEEKSQNGVVLKEANADCYATNYDEAIIPPSAERLRAKYGGSAPIGSASYGDNDGWGGSLPGGTMGQQGLPGRTPPAGLPAQGGVTPDAGQAGNGLPATGGITPASGAGPAVTTAPAQTSAPLPAEQAAPANGGGIAPTMTQSMPYDDEIPF